MQIRVDKLRKNLSLLLPVVPKKATLPVLTHVRLMDGKLTGTDLETAVSINLSEAREAAFLLPLRAAIEVLKYVPGDEMLTLELQTKPASKNFFLKLSWTSGSAAYAVKDVRDYPEIAFKEPRAEGNLNGDRLVEALVAALPYCATESTRPVLTGVTLYLGAVLQVAAADGYRLSFQSLNQPYPVEEKIVIPAKAITLLEHLWHREPAPVNLANDLIRQITQARQFQLSLGDYTEARDGHKPVPQALQIKFGEISLFSRLIAGTPPDHLALLNNFQEPVKVKLLAPELYNAVRRVRAIARDGTGIVRLQWTDSQMTVSARSEETGAVQATVQVEAGSIPGRTALNLTYLLDYLAGKDGLITLGKAEGTAPALFHYGARPIVAIMPMQVQWNEEKPVDGEPKTVDGKEEVSKEIEGKANNQESSSEPVAAGAGTAETAAEKPTESGETKDTPKRRGRRKKA